MNILFIAVLVALMHMLRSFSDGSVSASAGTSVALGFLLLTAYFSGRAFSQVRLPKLTGYLAAGVAVGPTGLGLLTHPMVESLTLVNGMAVALIALTAGVDLELKLMRPLLRTIYWISVTGVFGTTVLLACAVFVGRRWLPFMADMRHTQAVVVAALLGIVMVAQSPAVVVALRNELNADGPVSRTVLGVVVLADLAVILMFAVASSVAKAVGGADADVWSTLGKLAWELLGSMVIGVLLGYVLSLYLRKVSGGAPLFLLTFTFVIAEVAQRLHLDPLIVSLAAGALITNATDQGERVRQLIEDSALSIYVLFFAVAGATIHLNVLGTIGVPAFAFVLVRAFGLITGSRLGAALSRAEPSVRKYAGFGLLPQAGLALALSMLFGKLFPEFGTDAGALTLTVVAMNELLAPAIYRFALTRSGETDRHGAAIQRE